MICVNTIQTDYLVVGTGIVRSPHPLIVLQRDRGGGGDDEVLVLGRGGCGCGESGINLGVV